MFRQEEEEEEEEEEEGLFKANTVRRRRRRRRRKGEHGNPVWHMISRSSGVLALLYVLLLHMLCYTCCCYTSSAIRATAVSNDPRFTWHSLNDRSILYDIGTCLIWI